MIRSKDEMDLIVENEIVDEWSKCADELSKTKKAFVSEGLFFQFNNYRNINAGCMMV
jgi:hypothetical protein